MFIGNADRRGDPHVVIELPTVGPVLVLGAAVNCQLPSLFFREMWISTD